MKNVASTLEQFLAEVDFCHLSTLPKDYWPMRFVASYRKNGKSGSAMATTLAELVEELTAPPRKCCRCAERKPASEFPQRIDDGAGRASTCLACGANPATVKIAEHTAG